MPLQTGDHIPSATLYVMKGGKPEAVEAQTLLGKGTVVLFGVPGAFTPTCSKEHLPGFVTQADALKAKGVDTIACMAVNDVFVMAAWGEHSGVGGKVDMLADGNGEYTQALGLGLDASGFGMGQRGQRFAVVLDDGVVSQLYIEEGGAFKVSSAENVLENL